MSLNYHWPTICNNANDCCYCNYYFYLLLIILFLAPTGNSHPVNAKTRHAMGRLYGDNSHVAVDVNNGRQFTTSKYHPLPTSFNNNNNVNFDNGNDIDTSDHDFNINDNDDDDIDAEYVNGRQRTHRTMEIITRRKRFATAQTSRWDKMTPDNVLKLKWFISHYTRDMPRSEIRSVVRKSFAMWSTQTTINSMPSVKLQFEEAAYEGDADIVILWAEGDHGDAYKFDGTGNRTNILAHTFYPTYQEDGYLNGDIHLDDAEKWISDGGGDGTSFSNVFIHEIGHSLGLGHSKRADAIMYPIYKKDMLENASFDLDDKCALNWNYIGPTNLCLFVWLMSEVLPRQIEHKMNGQSAGVDFNIIQRTPEVENNIESKIATLKGELQESGVPHCSDDNNVRQKFEHLLQRKLDFSIRHAAEYGDVMCNFLAGLRKQIEGAGRGLDALFDSTTLDTASRDFLAIMSQPLRQPLRRKRRRLLMEKFSRHHHRHHQPSAAALTVFDSEFFNDNFYKHFLKMYVQ